jgi:RHS repeat-associated protein
MDAQGNQYSLGLMDYRARMYSPYLNQFSQPDTIVPNLTNPQSYNRYAYVLYNPIRYNDPSGHCYVDGHYIPDPSACNWINSDKNTQLKNKSNEVLSRLGGTNDLEAMAQIIDYGSTLFPDYDDLLPALTNIFNGVNTSGPGTLIAAAQMNDTNGCAGVGREPRDCAGAKYYFEDTGFHTDFQDSHNQPYHLWGYIANTASPGNKKAGTLGLIEAVSGNIAHEYVQSILANAGIRTDKGWGTSWNDFVLSEAGMEIGILITDGAISPSELGDVIRNRIGINGPGSNGVLQIYQNQYGPLYGTLHD